MLGKRLVGKNVELRPPSMQDASTYYKWVTSPEVNAFLVPPMRVTEGMDRAWLEHATADQSQILWANYADNKHVGFVRIYSIDWYNKRGYGTSWLGDQNARNHGYATEAGHLAIEFAFEETSLQKLQVEIFDEFPQARALAERLGFRHCGVARKHIAREGRWHDAWLGELLKEDWQQRQKPT